jgi:hypothetical protein
MRFLLICSLFLSASLCSLAQQATIIHGVSLRADPTPHNPPIETLKKGSSVTLLEPNPKDGFYHIKTSDGKDGWVGVKYLSLGSQEAPPEASASLMRGRRRPMGATGGGSTSASAQCDDTLWTQHVYNPQRLIVKQKCIEVTGTMVDATNGKEPDGVRHEADGDTHGWLKLDPQFGNLLNTGNMSDEGGNMVFEIVCKFPVTQQDARASCPVSYNSPVKIPRIGSHVRIVGSYVQDTNHARWMEIHPVSSIVVIP